MISRNTYIKPPFPDVIDPKELAPLVENLKNKILHSKRVRSGKHNTIFFTNMTFSYKLLSENYTTILYLNLAKVYFDGTLYKKNNIKAINWYIVAASRDNEVASIILYNIFYYLDSRIKCKFHLLPDLFYQKAMRLNRTLDYERRRYLYNHDLNQENTISRKKRKNTVSWKKIENTLSYSL